MQMKKHKYVVLFLIVIILVNFLIYTEKYAYNGNNQNNKLEVTYRTHVQDIGWQNYVGEEQIAGTEGKAKRLEGINIKLLNNSENISVNYQVHIQDVGWQQWKKDDQMAGTSGRSLRLEGIKMDLNTSKYSIMYRVHVQDIGWQDWRKDGEMAGTEGQAKRLEAIQIKIIQKENLETPVETPIETPVEVPAETSVSEIEPVNIDKEIHINYQAHVQDIGWQSWQSDGNIAGTEGRALRVEALKISLDNAPSSAHVEYRVHVQNIGWQGWKKDGEMAGTSGQGLRIEAIEIKIKGLDGYVVEYRAHAQDKGWQQWATNEMTAGTVSQGLRVEALQVRIVKQENTVVPSVKYMGHISYIGWEKYVNDGEIVGRTTGNNLEAIKIALENANKNAVIKYQVHVQNVGWMDEVSNNTQAGVTGQSKAIEAIKINLDGMQGYSIEYRAYVKGMGWQDWERDGIVAGTTGQNKQIGAIQIRLNIDAYPHNGSDFKNIDTARYPGYKELLERLQSSHPTWTIKLLYTGLNFNSAVYGEYSNHSANLVPASYGSEWICSICGTKLYDTGWYGASEKAIAYYLDPRNFLNESNIFQFLDANKYEPTSVSLDGIQVNVNGTFLQNYVSDINTACRNQGVNPYYVISRLIQENGRNGSATSRGMDGGDGKIYYNPFNIGASGNSKSQVLANALAKSKSYGWDTMEKALEGGIVFLKRNWLENYQNTLYQNRFDIDSTNGTSLYSHQYMQNLSAAYSEGNLLRGYYSNAGKVDSNLTFIIPVYEGMSKTLSQKP